jgi:beta-lactamase superfamily II metal-dependent hydrolase
MEPDMAKPPKDNPAFHIEPVADTGPVGGPAGIRVRMYRVGFGDFFLLSLRKDDTVEHILIDCGVHAKPTNTIGDAIAQLKLDTGGKIALIVMTHRHADHISGFASGAATFREFKVTRVWMPWFENPTDQRAVRFQANLTAVANKLQLSFAARTNKGNEQFYNMAENITGVMGAAGISSNQIALDTLHSGFAGKTATIQYLTAGDKPDLPPELIAMGLEAQILGPPSDPALISQMDGKAHQYLTELDAAIDGVSAASPDPIFDDSFDSGADQYDPAVLGTGGTTRIEKAIAKAQPDVVRAIAAQADNTINNQSVVVLFTFNGKKLLFAGDAQWGNWQNFLFGGALGSPGHAKMTPEATSILKSIDFYKVGHHGSTNATPIDALEAMSNGIVAMCSTAVDAYGKVANKSEVPRIPLMEALDKKTGGKLARSDQVAVPNSKLEGGPLDPVFSTPTGELFIDYQF